MILQSFVALKVSYMHEDSINKPKLILKACYVKKKVGQYEIVCFARNLSVCDWNLVDTNVEKKLFSTRTFFPKYYCSIEKLQSTPIFKGCSRIFSA